MNNVIEIKFSPGWGMYDDCIIEAIFSDGTKKQYTQNGRNGDSPTAYLIKEGLQLSNELLEQHKTEERRREKISIICGLNQMSNDIRSISKRIEDFFNE